MVHILLKNGLAAVLVLPWWVQIAQATAIPEPQSEDLPVLQLQLQTTPDDPFLHYQLGCLYLKKNQPVEAQQAFVRALNLKLGFAEAWAELGESLVLMEKPDMALKAYAKALQLQSNNSIWQAKMKAIQEKHTPIPIATPAATSPMPPRVLLIQRYQKAIAQDPNDPSLYCELGIAHLQSKQLEEAKTAFTQALRLKRDAPQAWKGFAVTHHQEQRFAMAVKAYEKVLELQPQNSDVQVYLKLAQEQQELPSDFMNTFTKPPVQNPVSREEPVATVSQKDFPVTSTTSPFQIVLGSPLVPAGASLALPGAGQVYTGIRKGGDWWDIGRGMLYMGLTALSYSMMMDATNKNEGFPVLWSVLIGGLTIGAPIDALLTAQK